MGHNPKFYQQQGVSFMKFFLLSSFIFLSFNLYSFERSSKEALTLAKDFLNIPAKNVKVEVIPYFYQKDVQFLRMAKL